MSVCHALVTVEVHGLKENKTTVIYQLEKMKHMSLDAKERPESIYGNQKCSYRRDKYIHRCGHRHCVFRKLVCLHHHSCREVSNNAHLVHIPITVNLPVKISWLSNIVSDKLHIIYVLCINKLDII